MRTKRKNYFCVLIFLLVLIEIATIFLMYKSSNNRNTLLDNVSLKEQVSNMNGLAIMLETTQTDGTTKYVESTSNAFPTDMKYNEELSGCIDNLGNKIPNSLTFVNGTAKVETSDTTYCYLYFDILPITADTITGDATTSTTETNILWQSTLEDDGYRYVGTDPNNYVCFGYENATTDCDFTNATNTDLYAYRIIGIFEDSEGTPHIKLIKKEALNSTYAWNANYKNDVDWDASDLYKGINGSYFLDNPTYSYMQDSTWTDKIAEWEYTSTNTQTYYIGSSTSNVGVHYYYSWPIGIYNSEHEIDTTTGCYQTSSGSAINCKTTASYTYPKAKISLMYASDYLLSLGSSALDYRINTQYSTLKTGWMHISNNDSGTPSSYEWTSSRYGFNGYYYYAWGVRSIGTVDVNSVDGTYSVRPVFYLTSEVELSGEGTSTSPYIIK